MYGLIILFFSGGQFVFHITHTSHFSLAYPFIDYMQCLPNKSLFTVFIYLYLCIVLSFILISYNYSILPKYANYIVNLNNARLRYSHDWSTGQVYWSFF